MDFDVGDLAGGGIDIGGEGVYAIAHAARGDGEHATELSAAEDADGSAGEDGLRHLHHSVSRSTRAVCSWR